MSTWQQLHERHPRTYRENKFVYPVLSRRSRGLSIGVNLNPDKVCNFDCIYCQVDRRSSALTRFVEIERLLAELEHTLQWASSGRIYEDEEFARVPADLRRVNDIAFSGDGEPTTYRNFDVLMEQAAAIKDRLGLAGVKLVLITNATQFHRPAVARGLAVLDAHQGEIWAKLDAGTEEYFRLIERTPIPFQQVLDNIRSAALVRTIVIQSLFLELAGVGPDDQEIAAYTDRLTEVVAAGGRIARVQVYTVARPPAEASVSALPAERLREIAEAIEARGIPAEVFPGRG